MVQIWYCSKIDIVLCSAKNGLVQISAHLWVKVWGCVSTTFRQILCSAGVQFRSRITNWTVDYSVSVYKHFCIRGFQVLNNLASDVIRNGTFSELLFSLHWRIMKKNEARDKKKLSWFVDQRSLETSISWLRNLKLWNIRSGSTHRARNWDHDFAESASHKKAFSRQEKNMTVLALF